MVAHEISYKFRIIIWFKYENDIITESTENDWVNGKCGGAAYEDGDNGESHAKTTIWIDRGYFGVSNSKFGIMYRFSSIATWIVHTKPTGPKAALTNLRSIYRGLHGGGPIIAVIAHKRTWLWDQWKSTSPLIRQGDYDWYSHRIWSTQNGWFVHSTTHQHIHIQTPFKTLGSKSNCRPKWLRMLSRKAKQTKQSEKEKKNRNKFWNVVAEIVSNWNLHHIRMEDQNWH